MDARTVRRASLAALFGEWLLPSRSMKRRAWPAGLGLLYIALIGALGPVTTIFFGWLGLDEGMAPVQLAGAALVLAGVVLVTLKAAK